MKFPLSWLKEYLHLSISPEEIAETLTLIGLEVEGLHQTAPSCKGVIIGKVVATSPHPDAQKLTIATVSDGKQEYQVVCGAPNCHPGLKTPFAPIGAQVIDEEGKPFFIKKAKLRGVESEGMLCAHDELGLPLEPYGIAEGIMELPENIREGTSIIDLFNDTIYEVAITPNLSHCLSVVGIARELAAVMQASITLPEIKIKENPSVAVPSLISVNIENSAACPRYACRILTDVTVGPSPEWLRARIEACGLKSVNVVVDVTNYILLEWGHPLHAFDYDTLEGQQIVVRNARHGESIVTLDGKEHFPTEETLLICDAVRPQAIAGIMGGQISEVTEKTKTILLEAAYFEPTHIRRASKRMGIHTEASRRFERGTDPNGVLRALDRAAALIQEISTGTVARGTVDIGTKEFSPRIVSCRLHRVNRILGSHLAMTEVETIFKRLGLSIHSSKNDTVEVIVPTYRHDIREEIDLIEEVARMYGYDNIHQQGTPPVYHGSSLPHHPLYLFEREIRSRLIGEGLQEFLTCNLISPAQADLVSADSIPHRSLIKILNPSSTDQSILRPSLLPNMLSLVKFNADREIHTLAGFEVGRVHFKSKDNYLEPTVASIVLTGHRSPHHWESKPGDFDFFDLKGIIENLIEGLRISSLEFLPSSYENFHPGRQARILLDHHEAGIIGEVHPNTLKRMDLTQPVFYAELNVEDLMQATKKEVRMNPLPHYPASLRDWTFTLHENCPIDKIFHLIQEERSSLLEEVSLLDIYHHEKLGKEWKNVTLRFVYRDSHQTVSFQAVEGEHARITNNITKKLQTEKKIQI